MGKGTDQEDPMKLTIGQVAGYVGVTIRAVRHYHQRGLLPEPDRDASGYRRYGASAVVDLIKIKTLAEAGVPLAQIKGLLQADPQAFAIAMARLGEALDDRIRELKEQQQRVAGLAAGDTLFLPDEIASLLDRLRAIGVSPRTVQIERDGWILLAARHREAAAGAAKAKLKALGEPDFRRIYLAFDEAAGWAADDPRLADIADQIVVFAARYDPGPAASPPADTKDAEIAMALMSPPDDSPPAWVRLDELCREKSQGQRGPA
jgi:DNA-binding transcriptional MerR regulator